MDIHKPKAAHNWREFLIEIGTITIGILIVLGLEAGVRPGTITAPSSMPDPICGAS